MGIYATVLSMLGLVEGLGRIADRSKDSLGLDIEEDRLPRKIQPRNRYAFTVSKMKPSLLSAVFVITLLSGFSSKSNAGKTDLDYSNYSCRQMEQKYEVLHDEIKTIVSSLPPFERYINLKEEAFHLSLSALGFPLPFRLRNYESPMEVPAIRSRVSELKKIAETPQAGKCTGFIEKIEKLRKVLGDELEREKRKTNDTELIR